MDGSPLARKLGIWLAITDKEKVVERCQMTPVAWYGCTFVDIPWLINGDQRHDHQWQEDTRVFYLGARRIVWVQYIIGGHKKNGFGEVM